MDRERLEITVSASLSRHNSPKDKEHDELWAELVRRIEEVVADPRYSVIIATVV